MILIVEGNLTDASAIAALHAQSWKNSYRGIYSDEYLKNEVQTERESFWKKRLTTPPYNQLLFLAKKGNQLLGFAYTLIENDSIFGSLLDNFHIDYNSKNKGIGKILFKKTVDSIQNRKPNSNLYLWVYESNLNARSIYKHWGGIEVEIKEETTVSGTKQNVIRCVWYDISKINLHH